SCATACPRTRSSALRRAGLTTSAKPSTTARAAAPTSTRTMTRTLALRSTRARCAASAGNPGTTQPQEGNGMYVYIESETAQETGSYPLYTVGHYNGGGKWIPESDHGGED